MDAVTLLQQQAKIAHDWLESTVGDVTAEQVQWAPPEGATLGGHYAHIVFGEDALINHMAKGEAPMAASPEWQGKTGPNEPMPQGPFDEWSRTTQFDVPALRAFGKAVFANTESYIASLTPEDLDREIDLTSWGMGKVPLGVFIGGITLANTNWHCGEISLIKGLQGMKGYPA